MEVYFLREHSSNHTVSFRTCPYHDAVFHGVCTERGSSFPPTPPPALNNSSREQLHVRRSGRFVPKIWMSLAALVVSDEIKQSLSRLAGTEFLPVVFERLVDVPMPSLGDFSWYQRITYPPGPEPAYELETLPDIPEFHQNIGPYWEVLASNIYIPKRRPADAQRLELNFGSFSTTTVEPVLVSPSALAKHPFVWGDILQLRKDAFEIIAPYIELDYLDVAWIDLDTKGK